MGKRLLIIEDSVDIRENTAELLELSGFIVETASDGLEGVCAPLFGPGLDAASDSIPKKLFNFDEKSTSIILILHNF